MELKIANVTERPAAAFRKADSTRITKLTHTALAVHSEDGDRIEVALVEPAQKGTFLDSVVAPAQKKVWAILSDSFMVAVGRYVVSASWAKPEGKWSPLRAPFKWNPYGHSAVFPTALGAPTADGIFVYAVGEAGASLVELRGATFRPAKRVERGHAAFDERCMVVVSKARRRALFMNAAGAEVAEVVLGARALGSLKSLVNVWNVGLRGREIWLHGYRGTSMCIELDADPPPFLVDTEKRSTKKRGSTKIAKSMPAGDYGAIEHPELFFKLPAPAVAFERVRCWDLNQTPAFAAPAPYGAMLVGDRVLTFCKRVAKDELREGFEFLAHNVEVAVTRAPKEARAPKGVVLVQLRTQTGLTQLLCRAEFATVLGAHCEALRSKRKRR